MSFEWDDTSRERWALPRLSAELVADVSLWEEMFKWVLQFMEIITSLLTGRFERPCRTGPQRPDPVVPASTQLPDHVV